MKTNYENKIYEISYPSIFPSLLFENLLFGFLIGRFLISGSDIFFKVFFCLIYLDYLFNVFLRIKKNYADLKNSMRYVNVDNINKTIELQDKQVINFDDIEMISVSSKLLYSSLAKLIEVTFLLKNGENIVIYATNSFQIYKLTGDLQKNNIKVIDMNSSIKTAKYIHRFGIFVVILAILLGCLFILSLLGLRI